MNREPNSVADEWLVLRCQEGSAPALEELLKRWRQRLWLHAIRVVGQEEAAQDVVQESLIAITQGIRKLDDPSRFPAWAYRIVTNKGRDWIRNQVRRRRLEDEAQQETASETETGTDTATSRCADVREALERLRPDQRDLLRYHYHLGLSLRDIAAIEAIPIGTVKSRLHEARAQLKRHLQPPSKS